MNIKIDSIVLVLVFILISCTPPYTFDNPVDPSNLDYSSPTLSIKSGLDASIRLKWTPNAGKVEKYHIYRGLAADEPEKIAEVGGDTFQYTDKSLQPGIIYRYYIIANLSGDEFSNTSNVAEGYINFSPGTFILNQNFVPGCSGGMGNKVFKDKEGKILVAGASYYEKEGIITLWRFTPEGQPDLSFNGTGCFTYRACDSGTAYGMAVDNEGKIWVTGGISKNNDCDVIVMKLNKDGSPDTSFSDDGILIIGNPGYDMGREIFIDGEGNILIGGIVMGDSDNDIGIWRFHPDGSPDLSFNHTGCVTHHNAAGGDAGDYLHAMSIDSEGRIVVAGESTPPDNSGSTETAPDMTLWRYLSDGTLDPGFGTGGFISRSLVGKTPEGDIVRCPTYIMDVVIDGKGGIITAGYVQGDAKYPLLCKFNTDGSVDRNFNDGLGFFFFDSQDGFLGTLFSVAVDTEDNIYAAGYIYNSPDSQTLLFKLLPGGSLDTSFGNSGYFCRNNLAGGLGDGINNIFLDGENTIFCTGMSFNGLHYDLTILKYSY